MTIKSLLNGGFFMARFSFCSAKSARLFRYSSTLLLHLRHCRSPAGFPPAFQSSSNSLPVSSNPCRASLINNKTLHKEGFIVNGALGGIRTHNLLIRSQMLYPIELRAHLVNTKIVTKLF